MNETSNAKTTATKNITKTERTSDCELVVTRTFNGPARLVFKAWATPALFRQWWVPKSLDATLVSCEMDVRTGGSYRLEFGHPSTEETMAFFGRYLEVIENARIVWTNEEGGDGGNVTTVTLEENGDTTLLTLTDLYASKAALDEAIESGGTGGFEEQFAQLDELLPALDADA